jgi:hypothetical protein
MPGRRCDSGASILTIRATPSTAAAAWTSASGGGGSFRAFLADVGLAPSPAHLPDRYPDAHGSYEPGNMRWATRTQQARNTRRAVLVTFDGVTMPLAECAERVGLPYCFLYYRVRLGWDVERAVRMPVTLRRRA